MDLRFCLSVLFSLSLCLSAPSFTKFLTFYPSVSFSLYFSLLAGLFTQLNTVDSYRAAAIRINSISECESICSNGAQYGIPGVPGVPGVFGLICHNSIIS